MVEVITSVGIDVGSSTTEVVFSRLTIDNLAAAWSVPRITIIAKDVWYRSQVHLTPLLAPALIDAPALRALVEAEYRAAGATPHDVRSGAVIITGQTARTDNADEVLRALSALAGDFVVATAGPDLESVMAARGASIDIASVEHQCRIANLDVGGGTTNVAVYERGTLRGTSCLDIGARLVRVDAGYITAVGPSIRLAPTCRRSTILASCSAGPSPVPPSWLASAASRALRPLAPPSSAPASTPPSSAAAPCRCCPSCCR